MNDILDYLFSSFWGILLVAVAATALLLVAIGLIIEFCEWLDLRNVPEISYAGMVIERDFTPSQTSTGVGFGGNGAMVTTSQSSEKFILFLQRSDGEIIRLDVWEEVYLLAQPGRKITYYGKTGRISKSFYLQRATI